MLECQHKNKIYEDRSGKHDENKRNDYGSRVSGLKGGSSEVVSKEEGSYIPALEATINVQQDC